MKKVVHNTYKASVNAIDSLIYNFDESGKQLGKGDRNKIKLYEFENKVLNIKAFKVPNIFNQIIYKFFRKSKAQRSYEYANKISEMNIGTPQPIAYYEFPTLMLFKKSFYVSEHLESDLTYRELTRDLNYPNHEKILRAFTRFTFELHEKGIYFLDHSPGNTLIIDTEQGYKFYLVDLNRMKFKKMNFWERIKNFERLTRHKSVVAIMSDEYAKCLNENYDKVFTLMWRYTQEFQLKFERKKRLKQKIKFWKKT